MADPATTAPLTYAEYRERERASPAKHEFVDGEIFAMSGARRVHNQIAANFLALCWTAFRERRCVVYGSDMRVVTADDVAAYPDVSALCGAPRFSDDVQDELVNPSLLVEVLSESTEAYDRGEKFEHYETIASLREYVLASSTKPRLEVFRRADGGAWTRITAVAGERVTFESVGVTLSVDEIYARAFEAAPA